MKRIITFVAALVLAAGFTGKMVAKPVDKATAASIAARVLNKAVVDATSVRLNGCFLFTGADGKGFVLMAADDRVRPVLAYSPDGSFDPSAMPDHVAAWIDGYRSEIASVVEVCDNPSRKVTKDWECWSKGTARGNTIWVDPLMTSRWWQRPLYNNYCPYDSVSHARTVTGCVATAMAQIMRYWQWPEVGYGSHSYEWSHYGTISADFGDTYYNWDQMPDTLSYACTSEEIDAVATLMYHAGVSVDMMYDPEGSGAYTASSGDLGFPCAENAYKTYFRYNPMLQSRHKSAYTDTEWDSLMRAELDAGRPVHYGAAEPYIHSGHVFVIDGYDSLGMFHVNWGWGGRYDAWYLIDSLAPGAGSMGGNPIYCFTGVAEAVFGIYPAEMPTGEPSNVSIVSNDPELGTVMGSGTYQTYDTVNVNVLAAEGCRYVRLASGKHAMPFSFLAIGQDYEDTAIFERITGDTIGYCTDMYVEDQPFGEGGTLEWGIRIPANMRQNKSISAVQIYYLATGDHTLNIYEGEDINDATLVCTKIYHLDGWLGWRTLELNNTLSFAPEQTVWITLSFTDPTGWASPVAGCSYCGNPDGSWYRFSESSTGWDIYHPISGYYTWMIRAVLVDETGIKDIFVTDGPSTGSGTFAYIDADGNIIITDGPSTGSGTSILQIYDVLGRQVFSKELSTFNYQLSTANFLPGVYVLRLINGDSVRTQKIVVNKAK